MFLLGQACLSVLRYGSGGGVPKGNTATAGTAGIATEVGLGCSAQVCACDGETAWLLLRLQAASQSDQDSPRFTRCLPPTPVSAHLSKQPVTPEGRVGEKNGRVNRSLVLCLQIAVRADHGPVSLGPWTRPGEEKGASRRPPLCYQTAEAPNR